MSLSKKALFFNYLSIILIIINLAVPTVGQQLQNAEAAANHNTSQRGAAVEDDAITSTDSTVPTAPNGGGQQNEATCGFSIGDAGDENPFSFIFNVNNPADGIGYSWDFGDGQGGGGTQASHTYGAEGQFTVTLTCSAADGSQTLSSSAAVSVVAPVEETPADENTSEPPAASSTDEPENDADVDNSNATEAENAANSRTESTGREELSSCQLDLNDSGDSDPFTFTFTAIATATFDDFLWDFGDGTTTNGQGPHNHTYGATGDYTISLVCVSAANGDLNLTGNVSIVNVISAGFSVTPGLSGLSPFNIGVVNTSSGAGLSYLWQVSGPEVHADRTDMNPSYTFTTPGDYTITLTVSDNGGQSAVAFRTVTVLYPPPDADFTVNPVSGTTADTFTIQGIDNGAGPITTWTFDWGDGTIVSGQGPHTHSYASEGTYWITLNYDGPGGLGSVARQIGVYAPGETVFANFNFQFTGNGVGGTEVCFNNTSTGPIVLNRWNFGDGAIVVDNSAVVCHTYAADQIYTVSLHVEASDPSVFSDATLNVNVIGAPVAVIGASTTNILYGGTVDFTGSGSTGIITLYEWDFDGDGVTDSTVDNPSNIAFTQLGNNPVRLTVTGPGGSSYAEVIIVVSQLNLTCNFTGNLLPPPGSTATYDATVGNVAGRAITYSWTITGPQNYSFSTEDISVTWNTIGAYFVTFTATADNGASCSTSRTVQVDWPDLTCSVNGTFAVLPDGSNHTYTAVVTGDAGRTLNYQWFVNGVDQGVNASTIDLSWTSPTTDTISVVVTTTDGSGNCNSPTETIVVNWPNLTCSLSGNFNPIPNGTNYTYTANVGNDFGRTLNYQWFVDGVDQSINASSIDLSWTAEGTHTIYVVVTTTDGSGNCTTNTAQQIDVEWPPLTCGISGNRNPIPNMPDQNRNYTYTANLTNTNGLTPTYQWFIDGVLVPGETGPSMTLSWEWDETGTYVISYTAQTVGPGGGNCGASRTVNVNVPPLTCAPIVGDLVPVVGETGTYQSGITNAFGRTVNYNWTLELDNQDGTFTTVATGTSPDITYTFNIPGAVYRITYSADVINPVQSCTQTETINVSGTGVDYSCDGWVSGAWAAPNPAGNYNYTILVDNSNGFTLNFDWVLSNSAGSRSLGTFSSTIDGPITQTFSGVLLGPADTYDLVVNVTSPDSPYTCSFPTQVLVVGTLNVQYTYTVNLNAIAVGEQICLTNASDTSHGNINSLTYSWDLGTSDNTLVSQIVNGQTLSCFSFNTPGAYNVVLTGTTPGGQTGTFTRTFNVYGLQSIAINRSNTIYAGSLMTFDAIGTNITSNYAWTFYDSGNNVIGTRTGQNVNFFFANPGIYRAMVSGSGPLGTTTAEVTFELIGLNDIRAAFVPSTYGGLAPLTICYTDNSFGVGINSWTWNFGNGQTLTYDNTNIPSQICSDYVNPGQVYTVTLEVSNGILSANASNVVRTYNVIEANAAFSIEPRGNGEFCFNPTLGTGINVMMWDFGDGVTLVATNNGQVCHNYQSSGYYLVTMSVSDGNNTGQITRPINVDLTTPISPANLAISATCDIGPVGSFTITNSGGTMTTPDRLTIRNAAGQVILVDDQFQLANGASQTYDVNGYGGMISLTTLDTSLTATMNCPQPPAIEVNAVCQGNNVAFVISNRAGSMAGSQTYDVRDGAGNLVGSGNFSLAQGAADVVVNTIEPYGTYTFSSSGAVGTFNITHACDKPNVPSYVEIEAVCSMTDAGIFRITNIGSDMVGFQNVAVTDEDGAAVTVNHSMFKLNAGQFLDIAIDDFDPYTVYTLTTSGEAGSHTVLHNCLEQAFGSDVSSLEFYGLSSDVLDLPEWSSVATCGYGCVPFRVYHTNETGDWEIFRLDGADEVNQETHRLNLSQGEGEGVDDYAPSRSPDAEWIVFSSNRDGNWEIYVAPTNGDTSLIQRVTFNSIAIDTDPMWGPNNYVVYESTRDGNWELYMVDMATGREFRLTEHEANDINPFWSPDGSKLLFQSDRDGGMWQIYELDLNNFTVERLSDGNGADVDAEYNFAGDQIAFRSYRDGENSVIYVMDADGRNVYPVTMPAEDATNHTWSPDDRLIAYQSDFDGDLDIYVYELETGQRRLVTDNTIDDYAPTWMCESTRLIFTSDITGDPNIFEDEALPMSDPAVLVEEHAAQMTFEISDDIYPHNSPSEENASREGQTVNGEFGLQTEFLSPDVSLTDLDLSFDGVEVDEEWMEIEACPVR